MKASTPEWVALLFSASGCVTGAAPREIATRTPLEPTPSASVVTPARAPEPAPAGPPDASTPAAPEATRIPTLESELARARAAGFGTIADIVEARVRQERRKMKLAPDEGLRAAGYLADDLPAMPSARELADVMPKTTVELVRSVRERGVERVEAERMAAYLVTLRAALKLGNPAPFDENCSHVVGREWHEIDYRGEGMTWENQQRIYARHGVTNFRDADNLQRFFRVEALTPYFRKLYRPEGSVP